LSLSDVIDNRNQKLVDTITTILDSTHAARFAVGYFFLSGWEAIAPHLDALQEMRLLIGNTSNRETIEQMTEGYRRLELVKDQVEEEHYRKRAQSREMAENTAGNLADAIALMDQTDEAERLIVSLARMIEEGRLKVRVYTRGRLHAKAYIFDYTDKMFDNKGRAFKRVENGIAIVGSSNLSLSGISHNTELNVVVHGNDNHADLVTWFDELWDEAEEFDAILMDEMQQSWALAPVRPYDIYMKTLYALVQDRIEGGEGTEILWDDEITSKLADFQKVAVRQAVQMIRDYGGAFVADVVGLGKSYIGAAILKHFERTERARSLIICPAPLVEMWERYNEIYQLNARVVSLGMLKEDKRYGIKTLLEDPMYRDRNFVLIDESHHLRNRDTQRYKVAEAFLAPGDRKVCLLTATPRNKGIWDVYNQIKLFHHEDKTDLPIEPPNLREYFKLIDERKRDLPPVLSHILVRRTRNHILRWYGFDSETHEPVDPAQFQEYLRGERRAYVRVAGRHNFFPARRLQTVEYNIEQTYQGLYTELRGYLGKPEMGEDDGDSTLKYARYGLWNYVLPEKRDKAPYDSLHRAGFNLRGLIRILMFKRFESSVYAFTETVRRMINTHRIFLEALTEGIVPAGEEAQRLLYESDEDEELAIVDALKSMGTSYKTQDFDGDALYDDLQHDLGILNRILDLVEPITPDQDDKLQTLLELLGSEQLNGQKILIFTQYADTAKYLHDNINPDKKYPDIDVIYSNDRSKAQIVGRFAPKANPDFQSAGAELNLLIATDVLAEGLNIQDGNIIINYDLHWNPVRLIQRFGRIDRIGTEHDTIFGFNFLPELGIEHNLGLKEKLQRRIQEIHDTIGEDAAILDETEKLNPDSMYAIYGGDSAQVAQMEGDIEEDLLDLNEAEEIIRQLRNENPEEFDRIARLRDGIRTGKQSETYKGMYVFCQAGRYRQLFLVDNEGNILSRDIPRILGSIKVVWEERGYRLPDDYNRAIMRVKQLFAEEAKHRQADRDHSISLTQGQRYVLRELKIIFDETEDEDVKGQINLLEKTFRMRVTTAINKELNLLRRNGVTGDDLLKSLRDIYLQHNMRDWLDNRNGRDERANVPRII
jgi:superfamily II DNA or RNA helicase